MITVVAFHPGDSAQAAAMLDWMADLCGQQDKTAILAHEERTPAQEVQRAASRAFTKVEHLMVSACADAWPISANCYFGCIAAEMRGREPWLLMEGDCTMTHPKGLDMLAADFDRMKKLALGAIIPAYFRKDGQWVETGQMLAGVAVYHPGLWDHSPLLRSLRATQASYAAWNKANPGRQSLPKAFDCYLSPEILPHAGSTPLIQHMGRSREFRREGKQIVCTYGPESRWSPVLDPAAVLVHGCKDGSLIALLRAEMGIALGKTASRPATIVMPAPAPRKEVKEFQWEDEKKPERPTERAPEPAREPAPALPKTLNKEAFATLGDARNAVQHWPDCKQAVFSLQEGRGRYRVACQCGSNSPKLPEGVDWEEVWRDSAATPAASELLPAKQVIEESHLLRQIDETLRPQEVVANPLPANGDGPPTHEFKTSPWVDLLSTPTTFEEMVAAEVAKLPPPPPIADLRFVKDIVRVFPELAKVTPGQRKRRMREIKKKDRVARMKPVAKALKAKTARILTSKARTRKLELLEMCKGYRGAWLALRRHAESLGLKGTKLLQKDQLIIAVLEKEFANPYEEFEKATA